MDLIVADIGGTHARFAAAHLSPGGAIAVGEPVVLDTGDHAGLPEAWRALRESMDAPLPSAAAIAIAAPIHGRIARMTNNRWVIDTGDLAATLGLERCLILNDFAAVAHCVATAPARRFEHLAGPDVALPEAGAITVLGPGTGLGVAHLRRFVDGYHVQATEGGHIAFGPFDALDDALLHRLRAKYGRVSAERVVSGPGLAEIHAVLAENDAPARDDRAIWNSGIAGDDALAVRAVDRFCEALGGVAGDLALAHGASGVVVAGKLARRLRDRLRGPDFDARFCAKGRYEAMMATIPVRLLTHPEPGLAGAAAAFAKEYAI